MGFFLMESRIGERVYTSMAPLLNHFPGGLLYANIIAGALFAACSGSSIASAATIGSVALPEMEKRRYPFSISAGSVGAGAILAPLIPPSLQMIFYASITEQSIGKQFMAGIIPGLILVGIFVLYIGVKFQFGGAWKQIRGQVLPWKTSLVKTRDLWLVLILVVMVLGSMFAGIATPTEAAAVGSFGALLLALLHRSFSWQMLKRASFNTVRITCQLMFIYFCVKIMSASLAKAGLISYTTKILLGLPVSPLVIIIMIYVLFLILGMVLESIPMMLIIVPIVFPTLMALGYNPIWFGIAVVLLCSTGNLSPPVGVTLFTLQSLSPGKSITEIYKGIVPFVLAMMLLLAIITAFPQITLYLPGIMIGR